MTLTLQILCVGYVGFKLKVFLLILWKSLCCSFIVNCFKLKYAFSIYGLLCSKHLVNTFMSFWVVLQEFKSLLKYISNDMVISCIDFSKNYAFKIQNEMQNMHWYNMQITILVHITYKMNGEYDVIDPQSSRVLKEVHYYISDDKTHDSLFVQHAFTLHLGYMKNKGCFPKQQPIWSDGCFAQFKCVRTWYFVTHYPQFTICDQRLEVSKCVGIISLPIMVKARSMGLVPFWNVKIAKNK